MSKNGEGNTNILEKGRKRDTKEGKGGKGQKHQTVCKGKGERISQ